MVVLHLTESSGWSGGTAQLLALAEGLRERGFESLVGSPPESEVRRRAQAQGIAHVPFAPFQDYDLLSAWRLARLCRQMRPDIVHAHHPRAHAVALAASYLLGAGPRLVVTRRVSFPIARNPFGRIKYLSSRVSAFIAVAGSIREELRKAGVPEGRIRVIHSGTDLSTFKPTPPSQRILRELALPDDVPVVGKIANFSPWKGQEIFLKAAALLKGRGVAAVFVLAGRGTEGGEVRAMAEALGLGPEDVRLLGFRMDVAELLSVFTLSVNSAVAGEGIPGTLREAMAMQIPVIASDAGGNPELVRPGETGELFARADPRALADRMELLLRDRERSHRLAAQGRRLVLREFSLEAMVDKTLELYRSLLGKRN